MFDPIGKRMKTTEGLAGNIHSVFHMLPDQSGGVSLKGLNEFFRTIYPHKLQI